MSGCRYTNKKHIFSQATNDGIFPGVFPFFLYPFEKDCILCRLKKKYAYAVFARPSFQKSDSRTHLLKLVAALSSETSTVFFLLSCNQKNNPVVGMIRDSPRKT